MDEISSDEDRSLRENVDLNDGSADHHMAMDIHATDVGEPLQLHQHIVDMAEPFVGMEFESEEAAKLYYMAYASRIGFSVRISKSRRSRNDESIIMRRFVCSKEGFHMKKDNFDDGKKRRKRATIREGCNAMIEVIQKYYGRWVVTKFVKEHNHMVSPPTRVRYVAPEEYADLEPFLGMEFQSHEDAQTFYYAYASRVGFDVRIRLSRRSTRDESFVMRRFVCTKEGFSPLEETFDDNRRKRNRAPVREGCKAMFEVIKKEFDRWVVSKLVTEHTHPLAIAPSKVHYIQSQSEVVVLAKTGAITHEKATTTSNSVLHVGESTTLSNDPSTIVQNSMDSRDSRQNVLAGLEDSQSLLEYFKRMQAENPTFLYAFQVDKNNCLTNIFWADSKAKMAYYCFGDAVTFDTSYKNNKHMMPFVTFSGVNNHLQEVVFGCALLTDENESSYIWLFENWSLAMCGRPHPISLVIDLNETIKSAASRVFPGTHIRFNKWCILRKCREKLSNIYATNASFEGEFEQCINRPETMEVFESCWSSILDKYGLRENAWLQSIFDIRHQWVSIYLKETFSAEVSPVQRPESMSKFFEKYFNSNTSLPVFISLFEQAMSSWSENESLEEFADAYTKPILKTPSLMLKQAAEYYTRTIFDIFQDEFVESLGYFGDKIGDGEISKYTVAKDEDTQSACIVTYNSTEKKASCSCCKFEVSGILCRHILRVFLIVGVRSLPEEYVLKRWTKNAKGGLMLDECVRYNDLCRDAVKYAKEGASSLDIYKIAKEGLQMAFAEVITAKKDIANRCPM